MKKILTILAIATTITGCSGNKGYESVDSQKFEEFLITPNVQLVDSRTPEEFSEGHIPGAQNINIKSEDFDAQICSLDKSQPVAVYCRGGRRSKEAAKRLVNAGFKVVELDSGILSWKGAIEK